MDLKRRGRALYRRALFVERIRGMGVVDVLFTVFSGQTRLEAIGRRGSTKSANAIGFPTRKMDPYVSIKCYS